MSEQLRVVISSTVCDLPVHRGQVMDACLRQGMFPVMMEHLPATDAEAISASRRMVDDSDVYLLVLAHRYGYIPKGYEISVTEMEYNRAVERNIPRLVFLMDDDHPIKASDVETGDGAANLKALKDQIGVARVKDTFVSPLRLIRKMSFMSALRPQP
jgi:hypothetical protein